MSENRSYRAWVLGGLAVVVVAAVVEITLALGRHGQQAVADTPEATVATIYRLCQEGQYDQTGPYYLGGPETDQVMRKDICEKITEGRTITGWEIRDQATAGNDVAIQSLNYRDAEAKTYGRLVRWRLTRQGGRWRVAEVV